MMQRAGHHARAAALLRSDLHRELCERYRMDRGASADSLDAAAVARDGLVPGMVRSLLTSEPRDGDSLLELANRIAALRTAWTHPPELASAPRGAPP